MSSPDPALSPPADPGASPAPPAAPPAEQAAPPAAGRVDASPASSPAEPLNLRQLREQYETLKGQYEPWSKLNAKPDEVRAQITQFQGMRTEAEQLGQLLGYDAKEVKEFFQRDPVHVLAYLRQQAASQQSQPPTVQDLRQQLDRMVEDRLKPITAREDQRLNQEAESRFNREVDRLFSEKFKEGLPDEAKDAIMEMVGQLVGEDESAVRRLKFEGQTSDVAKYFEAAAARFLKVMTAYSAHERKRTGGAEPPNGPPLQPKPKSKLDQTVSGGQTIRELMNL